MRRGEEVGRRAHRADRDPARLRRLADIGLGPLAGPGLHQRPESVPMLGPPQAIPEARVGAPRRPSHQVEQALPLGLLDGSDEDVPVLAWHDVVGGDLPAPHQARGDLAAGEKGGDVAAQHGKQTLLRRYVDVLAPAGPIAREQRPQRGHCTVQARKELRQPTPRLQGRLGWIGRASRGDVAQPADMERHQFGGGVSATRSRVPERGDRYHDEPRVARRQGLVPEPEVPEAGLGRALHEHVTPLGQPQEQAASLGGPGIERDPSLVRVQVQEESTPLGMGNPLREGTGPAAPIAAGRGLDLDHVGPEIAEHLGAMGSGHPLRVLEHPHAGQGTSAARRVRHGVTRRSRPRHILRAAYGTSPLAVPTITLSRRWFSTQTSHTIRRPEPSGTVSVTTPFAVTKSMS